MPRTFVIGRSPFADVVVADATVAPHHLELVVADDGRLHATDCATATGSWQLMPAPDCAVGSADEWIRIRQAFVVPQTELRLGDYRCTVAGLLSRARYRAPAGNDGDGSGAPTPTRYVDRSTLPHRGRVERDAATGEIVRRRP